MSRAATVILGVILAACDVCPPTRPPAFASCDGADCGASLEVRASDSEAVPPSLHCDGFPASGEIGPDACTFASPLILGSSWAGGGDADLVATTMPILFGYFYRLEVEARDRGRARLCRLYVTDVPGDECSPPADCAIAGEVVLTRGGGGTVDATFAGGATIDAAF